MAKNNDLTRRSQYPILDGSLHNLRWRAGRSSFNNTRILGVFIEWE